MPTTDLGPAILQIQETEGVMDSAKLLIDTFTTRMQTAVDAALENGATAAQLAPLTAELAIQKSKSDELAASVAANP